jgi:hypothetical protein
VGVRKSKQEIVDEISSIALAGKAFPLSVGSSIPKQFFLDLEFRFGVPSSKGMENKGATFCEYFGVPWTDSCDSASSPSGGGGTVTRTGLLSILETVNKAIKQELN